jgi:predicted RNA-binding protein (virulence factor B family)
VGEIAPLEVISVHPRAGAFLNWDFPKDLLLPFKEQNHRVKEGEIAVIKVLHDEVSDRIIATSKINRYLNQTQPRYQTGDQVSLIIQERTPLGYMAIVDQRFRGLIHESSLQHRIHIGESMTGFVAAVKPDGKIDLSLQQVGYGRVTQLTDRIIEAMEKNGGRIPLTDKSSPEEIQRAFNVSKKAFKQAVGALYRQQRVSLETTGIALIENSGN